MARRISQISDICGMEGEVITMNDVAMFEFEGESSSGTIVGKYHTAGARPSFAPPAGLLRPGERLDGGVAEHLTC